MDACFGGSWLHNEGKLRSGKLQQANFLLRHYVAALGTALRLSWVELKCGCACFAKGGGLQLWPSQSRSLLSCYRRGQAVLGVTAFVTGEQRYLCTGFWRFDCTIEDSSASWHGARGWEDAIIAGCPARVSAQLCCLCKVPLVQEEVATRESASSGSHHLVLTNRLHSDASAS